MVVLLVLLLPMVSLPAGSLRDDPVPRKVSSHASSCIPPISPTADLSDLVNRLLPPAGHPFYRGKLQNLLTFFRFRAGITPDIMRIELSYSDGNGGTGITEEALAALFVVQLARFEDITRIINDMLAPPVNDVMGNEEEEGEEEGESSLSSLTAVAYGDADHRGDNAGEVGPPADLTDTLVGINGGANGQDGHTQRLNRAVAWPAGGMNLLVEEDTPAAGQDGTDGRLLRPLSGSDTGTTGYGFYGSGSTPNDSNPQ
jgi:hypothetical protein